MKKTTIAFMLICTALLCAGCAQTTESSGIVLNDDNPSVDKEIKNWQILLAAWYG